MDEVEEEIVDLMNESLPKKTTKRQIKCEDSLVTAVTAIAATSTTTPTDNERSSSTNEVIRC